MLDPELSVPVRVDPGGGHLHLVVTGCPTAANQQGLHPVIGQSRTLTPAAEVFVDLGACASLEPAAVELLRAGIEQERRDLPGGKAEVVLPEPVAAADSKHRSRAVQPGEDPLGCFVGRGIR